MNRLLPHTYLLNFLSSCLHVNSIKTCLNNGLTVLLNSHCRAVKQTFVVLATSIVLSACSTTDHNSDTAKQASHHSLIYATEQLQQCKEQGHDIAESASRNQSLPQYLLAAKHFRSCSKHFVLSETKPVDVTILDSQHSDVIPINVKQYKTAAMQVYVASVMNFIKAGELDSAMGMVTQFKQVFPKQDFYFANYTSFIDTAEALLQPEHITPQVLATLNISAPLRQELLRKQYWLKN